MEYQMRNWRHFNWLWAGSPAGLQIHNTDIVNWVKGSYPIRAHVPSHFFIEYEYADGTKLNSQIRTVLGTFNKGGAYFQGTKGTANAREGIKDQAGKSIWRYRGGDNKNPYQLEHDQFFALPVSPAVIIRKLPSVHFDVMTLHYIYFLFSSKPIPSFSPSTYYNQISTTQ